MNTTKIAFSKESLLFFTALLLLVWLCYDGLLLMVDWWQRDEYSHGYMIPMVAAYLLWQRRDLLVVERSAGSPWGLLALLLALLAWLLGELSAIYTIIQYAFLLGVLGLSLLWVGVSGTRVIWAAIAYLIFMIPLPNFLYFNLSQELQLISSALGVGVIRLFGISVYLEGNVIDLGVYQLQVVEACSGLRYLFPLMSFGFLIAYIYRGSIWQRAFIFLSTIPITVLMNSFRIGVIGVTVEHFGIAAAEGFLHDFEGWFVFMACLGVLLAEIWLLYFFSARREPFSDLFDLDFGAGKAPAVIVERRSPVLSRSAWFGLLMLFLAIPSSLYFSDRRDVVPERSNFADFPLAKQGWIGREKSLEKDVLEVLNLTDYIMADYRHDGSGVPVNFYSAWYQEQRKGASIHSPRSCLPGGGWEIQQHDIVPLSGLVANDASFRVNRVVMQMANHRQLVYYWFQGRGRVITNEYMAKWYIFWDSLTRRRTDGALVRLVTYVPENSEIAIADRRMESYLATFYNSFPEYIPD